jgi:hypothetical protein
MTPGRCSPSHSRKRALSYAGIWRKHQGPIKKDGPSVTLDVFYFMTTTPNALVATVNHERMPVLLATEPPRGVAQRERRGGVGARKAVPAGAHLIGSYSFVTVPALKVSTAYVGPLATKYPHPARAFAGRMRALGRPGKAGRTHVSASPSLDCSTIAYI